MAKDKITERTKSRILAIGKNIAYYRELQKLAQEDLARKAGISTTTLSRIESSETYTVHGLPSYIQIADILKISMDTMMDWSNAEKVYEGGEAHEEG